MAIVVIVVGAIAALVLVLWRPPAKWCLPPTTTGAPWSCVRVSAWWCGWPPTPTTGYSWAPVDLDASLLEAEEPLFQADSAGAGGTESLGFRALVQGQTTLTLAYRRPWGRGRRRPLETVTFAVTVR